MRDGRSPSDGEERHVGRQGDRHSSRARRFGYRHDHRVSRQRGPTRSPMRRRASTERDGRTGGRSGAIGRAPQARADRRSHLRSRSVRRRCREAVAPDPSSRHRRSSSRTRVGVSDGSSVQSGSALVIAPSTSADDWPGNGRWPVAISYRTQPNAQMSDRLSTGSPRACSGLMYATVPSTTPSARLADRYQPRGAVRASDDRIFAMPKSSTLTTPPGVILMLAGFRSRWTMPLSCAASSASAICRAIAQRVAQRAALRGRPSPSRSASVTPSTSSSTSARTPSLSSSP